MSMTSGPERVRDRSLVLNATPSGGEKSKTGVESKGVRLPRWRYGVQSARLRGVAGGSRYTRIERGKDLCV